MRNWACTIWAHRFISPKGAGVSVFKSKSQWWRKSLNLSQRIIMSSQGYAIIFQELGAKFLVIRPSGLQFQMLRKCCINAIMSTFYSAFCAISCSMRSITAALSIREGVNWKKKTFSFGHCPNYLTPPPWPQFGQLGPLFSEVEIQDLKVSLELRGLIKLTLQILSLSGLLKCPLQAIFELPHSGGACWLLI